MANVCDFGHTKIMWNALPPKLIINVFTGTFYQLNMSLVNNIINFLKKILTDRTDHTVVVYIVFSYMCVQFGVCVCVCATKRVFPQLPQAGQTSQAPPVSQPSLLRMPHSQSPLRQASSSSSTSSSSSSALSVGQLVSSECALYLYMLAESHKHFTMSLLR